MNKTLGRCPTHISGPNVSQSAPKHVHGSEQSEVGLGGHKKKKSRVRELSRDCMFHLPAIVHSCHFAEIHPDRTTLNVVSCPHVFLLLLLLPLLLTVCCGHSVLVCGQSFSYAVLP